MDLIKKLTGKNQSDYEQAAAHIINDADEKTFEELVQKDDFLFDFIKQNVAKRLNRACNQDNFKNLLKFLKYYSPSYDEFIAKTLAHFSDNEVQNKMIELLKNGTDSEKAYSAKYFSIKPENSIIEELKNNAYADFEPLAINSTLALSSVQERTSVENALKKLNSDDDFEILAGVKFLSAYGEFDALKNIFQAMKKSSMAEYIACEIGYMESILNLLNSNFHNDTLLAINNILQGLGEIVSVSDIFTFELYNVFENLIFSEPNSKNAVLLLTAKNKFNQLTENDEYLFDEDKNTKDEVFAITKLLNDNLDDDLDNFITPELNENSEFVFYALELVNKPEFVRPLLKSKNQTLILKSLEILKNLTNLTQEDKDIALSNITDENIKSIILAL